MSAVVSAGQTGLTASTSITYTMANPTGTQAVATALINGSLTGLTIGAGGSGYVAPPRVVFSAPTGLVSGVLGTTAQARLDLVRGS
ncbi:hypothetical protein, partial [Staphylococcus aureus]